MRAASPRERYRASQNLSWYMSMQFEDKVDWRLLLSYFVHFIANGLIYYMYLKDLYSYHHVLDTSLTISSRPGNEAFGQ